MFKKKQYPKTNKIEPSTKQKPKKTIKKQT